jgi:hypothetical protein
VKVVAVSVLAFAALIVSTELVRAQVPTIQVDLDFERQTLSWQDVSGESAYRVSGTVTYIASNYCELPGNTLLWQEVDVSTTVAADTTTLALPSPPDTRADSVKDVFLTVEALDSAGQVIASGSMGLISEPAPCPPDPASPPIDVILPDSGSASEGTGLPLAPVVLAGVLLATLSLSCLAVLRRRRP